MSAHYSVMDVASELATTRDHVLDLIHTKRLRAVNIGMGEKRPRWRISREALDDFLAARTTKPKQVVVRKRRPARTGVEYF